MLEWHEIIEQYNRQASADRIGPDFPFTHWRLYFKRLMVDLCREKFAEFGENSEFRPGAYAIACSKIAIGPRVTIRPQTMLFADPRHDGTSLRIEEGALLGSAVHVYTSNHRFDIPDTPIIEQGHSETRPVLIRKGCWIGAKAVILPGVEIGENSIVGAGSVVTRSVPPRTVAAGNPARVIREL